MLTSLDETLLHQFPATFGEVHTSDHRFFDRNWFGQYSPDGRFGVITGIAAYANMNALDGFAAVQYEGRQYNLRTSRPLRPRVDEVAVGPLRHEVIEPLWRHRLVLEKGEHPVAFDLQWSGFLPAHEEPQHFGRLDGRVFEDYRRFDQVGKVEGWIEIEGERAEARDWFAARDHSWGVRRGVGGYEPFTGTIPPMATDGMLFLWMEFSTPEFGGHFQLHENGGGERQFLEGFIEWPEAAARPRVEVVDVEHEVGFHSGTRAYQQASVRLTTADGAKWEVEAEPILTAWAYIGTGYDGGFDDKQGLGFHRGEVVEHDVYDVSHPEDVKLPGGEVVRPLHREQGARIRVNGVEGFAHFPIIPIGPNTRYGLGV